MTTENAIYYIGTCSENPWFPSWANIPDRKNLYNDPEIENFRDQELSIAQNALSWSQDDYTRFYADEHQRAVIKQAKTEDCISLFDLVFVMAKDDICSRSLQEIWATCGLASSSASEVIHTIVSSDGGNTWEKANGLDDDLHTRAMAWYWTLRLWTTEKPNYFFMRLPDITSLPIEQIQSDNNTGKRDELIRLPRLKEYFERFGACYKIQMALPRKLFPPERGGISDRAHETVCLAKKYRKESPDMDIRRVHTLVSQDMKLKGLKPYSNRHFDRLVKELEFLPAKRGNSRNKK